MSTHTGNPETAAEGLVRLAGAGLAVVGLLTMRGLYLLNEPSNWLSNLGVSIGDNSFRTLSGVAIIATLIGAGLYLRKGLWIIIFAGLIALAYFGHKYGWYSLNNQVTESVQQSSVSQTTGTGQVNNSNGSSTTVTWKDKQYTLTNTKVKMTSAHLGWCWEDDNGNKKKEPADTDGVANKYNSPKAVANCSTGMIHK